MNPMSPERAAWAGDVPPAPLDPRYVGYFHHFNQGLYYEAHEVLEPLWLAQRAAANGAFYKGLIQLAGAFVHIQKQRADPAKRLFLLAQANLRPYPSTHLGLDLTIVQALITHWLHGLTAGARKGSSSDGPAAPILHLATGP